MFPDFIAATADQLTESTSIAMLQAMQRSTVVTPLADTPIATAVVTQVPGQASPDNFHPVDATERDSSNSTDAPPVEPSAPPIVLLHGFDSSLLEFRRLLPRLGPAFPTWAIDLLGFGFTDRPAELDFTPETIKTHLYYTWKTLIQRPMVLVGASMGGAAAIDFALTYPDAVEKLVLIDSAGFAKGPVIANLLARIPAVGRWTTDFLSRPAVRRQVSRKAYFDDATYVTADAECCAALHLAMPRWSEALIRFTCSGGYNFLTDKISQVDLPSLVLWGRQDQILGTKDATRFEQALPQGQLIWLDDCGHVPHLEQPQATAEAIQTFIRSH